MTEEPEAGRIVGGRYRLVHKLGAGGFGQVWAARDEVLAVDVALKEVWLPPAMSDAERDERMARAEREARNAARLRDHPNIVAIHDVVMDGAPWIVMQLVAGHSLQQRIEEAGRLPADEVARIGAGILRALAAAHGAGIVHRDVKPANILLTGDGGVLLGDFGIAVHQADTALTATGAFVGSIEYVAPERARGDDGLAASDLFSLGATLYQAVEGFSPFHRNTPTGSLTAVLFEQPPPPRHAGEYEALLAALLAKDAGARPTAVRALEMLEAVGGGAGSGSAAGQAPSPAPGRASGQPPGPAPSRASGLPSGQAPGSAPTAPAAAARPFVSPITQPARDGTPNHSRMLAAISAAVVVLAGAGGITWWATSGSSASPSADSAVSGDHTGSSSTAGSPLGGHLGTSVASSSSGPSSDQLKKVLISGGDITGYTQDAHTLDYSVGMYLYQTQGGCAPMDQLSARFDGDRDISMPRASAALDIAGQSANTASVMVDESVEYYGSDEAQALMRGFHDLSSKCQGTFSATDSGTNGPSVVKPIPVPEVQGQNVDCVEYDFDGADQPGHNLTAVARVGGTLVTFKLWSETAPASNIDPALISAAVKKVQAAGLPG